MWLMARSGRVGARRRETTPVGMLLPNPATCKTRRLIAHDLTRWCHSRRSGRLWGRREGGAGRERAAGVHPSGDGRAGGGRPRRCGEGWDWHPIAATRSSLVPPGFWPRQAATAARALARSRALSSRNLTACPSAPGRAGPLSTAARRTPPSAAGTPGSRMRCPPGGPVPGCRSWTAAGPPSRNPGTSRSCSAVTGPFPGPVTAGPSAPASPRSQPGSAAQPFRKGIGQGDSLPVQAPRGVHAVHDGDVIGRAPVELSSSSAALISPRLAAARPI